MLFVIKIFLFCVREAYIIGRFIIIVSYTLPNFLLSIFMTNYYHLHWCKEIIKCFTKSTVHFSTKKILRFVINNFRVIFNPLMFSYSFSLALSLLILSPSSSSNPPFSSSSFLSTLLSLFSFLSRHFFHALQDACSKIILFILCNLMST